MKRRKAELDVDFIGGLGALTREDESAISDFIKARKLKQAGKATQSTTIRRNARKVVKEKVKL
ncbi:hypothetical protein SAMN05518672_103261 [Chitinophaga sp. CF118]|uniref:hypothetical protein n=1 Tax=Chitinophaga sp. CF118 TaxID=1884367 RepID=UPI0008EACA55|nr:hypothetical protein [Chitinophaga sp. CF118]SFD79926.1 hypothetical protein SAMN05518672_103261 [Chitinophaga sp. CF118]